MLNNYSGLHIFDSPESAAMALAERMIDQTRSAIQRKNRCVWAVSGGSSILRLYDALKEFEDVLKGFSEKLIVIWVDERAVPHSHESSNFGNAYNHFWKNFDDVRLIPVPYHSDAERASQEYEKVLDENDIDLGDIDIIVLGMGSDGHTASLFPGNKALEEKDSKIISVDDSSVEQSRVSFTYPFINSSQSIYLYFYGENKAEIYHQARLNGDINVYPILGIDFKKTKIFSDRHLE